MLTVEKKGVVWTGVEKTLVCGVNFLQGILLARMLSPGDFGLASMLGIFLVIGNVLAESGLGTALVVEGAKGVERKALKWNVGMAIGVYALLAIGAPLIAAFYHQPILRELTWVMGLGIILNAAGVVPLARQMRAQKFAVISAINLSATFAGFAVGVALAWFGYGVWAIAGVGLTYAAVRLGGLAGVGRKEKGVESSEAGVGMRALLKYGAALTFSGLLQAICTNAYQFIIGKIFSPAQVGLFTRGQRWAQLPGEVANESVGRVALVAFSKESGKTARSLVRYGAINLALLVPALVLIWVFANEVVGLVLGEAWLKCVPYLRILIFGAVPACLSNIAHTFIKASGRGDLVLKGDFIKKPMALILLVAGCVIARGWTDGCAAICWAAALTEVVNLVVNSVLVGFILAHKRTIHFVHRIDPSNAGDGAACPADYFRFKNAIRHDIGAIRFELIKKDDVVILGGGGLVDCLGEWNRAINRLFETCEMVIAWGVGENDEGRLKADEPRIDWKRFKLVGRRDREGEEFVPCVSAMSPLFDRKARIRREVGILAHKDHPLEGAEITNGASMKRIVRYLGESRRVITNTYHGWYWARLLGKDVELAGARAGMWSGKFDKLPRVSLDEARARNRAFYAKVKEIVG